MCVENSLAAFAALHDTYNNHVSFCQVQCCAERHCKAYRQMQQHMLVLEVSEAMLGRAVMCLSWPLLQLLLLLINTAAYQHLGNNI